MKRIYISGNIYIYIYDVGQIRDLSTFSCGGFRIRKEEELERSQGCLGVVWTVPWTVTLERKKWK